MTEVSVAPLSLQDEIAAAFAAGDHRAALALAEVRWPDLPDAALGPLADLCSAHGQNPLAARIVAHLAGRENATPQLRSRLAQLQWMAGDTPGAVATARECLRRHPQFAGLFVQLGMIQLSGGQHLDALLAYAAAHSLDPNLSTAALGRACAFRLLTGERVVPVTLGSVAARFALTGRSVSVDFVHLAGRFYEEEELAALAELTPRGGVIADIGANLGNHAIFFLHALTPSELHLFEPNPACLDALSANLAQNSVAGTTVHTHRCGVGATAGELFFNGHDDLNNGLVPVAGGRAERVRIQPLDDLLSGADLLKIDVEGMELEVLAGAERLIRESQPFLFVEVQERNRTAFARWLSSHGYRGVARIKYGDYANVLAHPSGSAL